MNRFRRWLGKAVDCLLQKTAGQAHPLSHGQLGEQLACRYLQHQGLQIIRKNFGCKAGELDLIAKHAETIVFIEVRVRTNSDFGGAASSITHAKQQRLRRAAQYWLSSEGRRYAGRPCRFDAVLLTELDIKHCEWVRNVFPGVLP